ncbi:butyrate kinase [Candidatus Geothermarchaeota archaeon ex4572_27]|nr:MAG: butyrate kinase [Candidatus Geothermarchaeota archaeon ex4572_27]
MRSLGIDPGTGSFDLVVLDDGRVVYEESVDTAAVAAQPELLIGAIERAGEVDVIGGPSGYGVPVTRNDEILDPWRFALEVLLLTREGDLRAGSGELGMKVYEALAKVVVELWRRRLPVLYIPSAVLLPTIPPHRKVNRLDMGTADKVAVAALGVVDQATRLGLDYEDVSFILVELGLGYTAVIAVDRGLIVDGMGGTMAPIGFLAAGAIDAELAVMGREWSRSDVFHGGVSDVCGSLDLDEALRRYEEGAQPCAAAVEALLEGVVKAVRAMTATLPNPREVLLSGRLSRHPKLSRLVRERLERIAPVAQVRGLPGARLAKEAAQGYAVIADGLAGGPFKGLVEHMRIPDARGTVLDWAFHPRLRGARERLRSVYAEVVARPRL